MKIIYSIKYRVLFSILIGLILITTGSILDGYDSYNRNITQLKEFKTHMNYQNNSKEVLSKDSTKVNRITNEYDLILENKYTTEPIVFPIEHHIKKSALNGAPFILALSTYVYFILYCIFLFKSESHEGWKRLSILTSCIGTIVTLIIIALNEYRISTGEVIAGGFLALALFHGILTFMLVAKRSYIWVATGFKNSSSNKSFERD